MNRKTTIVVAALVLAGTAVATEYFVAPDGCDGSDGSAAKPWRPLQRAAVAAPAGAVVTIRGGTYREWVKPANAGRVDAPITYQAANGEKVVVTGADPVTGWTRRPDGLWTVRLRYDSFGGLNPFTDFISGDWFGNGGRPRFRTRLIQDGRPLELHTRDFILGHGGAANRALVNIAGITSGTRTVPGDSAAAKSPNVKPAFRRSGAWSSAGSTTSRRSSTRASTSPRPTRAVSRSISRARCSSR